MPGNVTPHAPLPRLPELLLRLLLAGALAFCLSAAYEKVLVGAMLPLFDRVITTLDSDFTILGSNIGTDRTNAAAIFRANLSHPLEIGGKTLYPFGYGQMPAGAFQVAITLGGVLGYADLLLILVLAWPGAGVREYGLRIVIAAPLIVALMLIDVPVTVLGELVNGVTGAADQGRIPPLLICSRLLMGGGGFAIAAFLAFVAISLAARLRVRRPRFLRA